MCMSSLLTMSPYFRRMFGSPGMSELFPAEVLIPALHAGSPTSQTSSMPLPELLPLDYNAFTSIHSTMRRFVQCFKKISSRPLQHGPIPCQKRTYLIQIQRRKATTSSSEFPGIELSSYWSPLWVYTGMTRINKFLVECSTLHCRIKLQAALSRLLMIPISNFCHEAAFNIATEPNTQGWSPEHLGLLCFVNRTDIITCLCYPWVI
jgi:hypothetical protein